MFEEIELTLEHVVVVDMLVGGGGEEGGEVGVQLPLAQVHPRLLQAHHLRLVLRNDQLVPAVLVLVHDNDAALLGLVLLPLSPLLLSLLLPTLR